MKTYKHETFAIIAIIYNFCSNFRLSKATTGLKIEYIRTLVKAEPMTKRLNLKVDMEAQTHISGIDSLLAHGIPLSDDYISELDIPTIEEHNVEKMSAPNRTMTCAICGETDDEPNQQITLKKVCQIRFD